MPPLTYEDILRDLIIIEEGSREPCSREELERMARDIYRDIQKDTEKKDG